MDDERAAKRTRVCPAVDDAVRSDTIDDNGAFELKSMSAPVSPPRKKRRDETGQDMPDEATVKAIGKDAGSRPSAALRSPFQLTSIHDLPASANIDTVMIKDVFGDPRVVQCWEFNFLHDLDFLMDAFDSGARQRGIAVHLVHGFWKREDPRRERLETAARQYAHDAPASSQGGSKTTVTLHTAFMPEPFGTHHTKMAVLFRSDGVAQVVIHTANLIPHDWQNMTQAVWRSPLLPLLQDEMDVTPEDDPDRIGGRFKHDFLSYLRSYNQRRAVCKPLVEALERYDFSAVRAVLIGSVPGRHPVPFPDEDENDNMVETKEGDRRFPTTHWGWLAMQRALREVSLWPQGTPPDGIAAAEVAVQISSIATLGGTDAWLQKTLFAALSGGKVKAAGHSTDSPAKQLASFGPLRQARPKQEQPPKPRFRIIFPTADEIRRSLEGYDSGSSIHAKIQSPQQQKQLAYMKPMLCHWANDAEGGVALPAAGSNACVGDAKRRRAAPHVKTYVRYSNTDGAGCHVDWALLTSANLSKQAWGEARSAAGEMRIASYELGVLVWPALLTGDAEATMQPVFGRDSFPESTGEGKGEAVGSLARNVPLRIPYSLPLQGYGPDEIPWVASLPHSEPDWRGATAMPWED